METVENAALGGDQRGEQRGPILKHNTQICLDVQSEGNLLTNSVEHLATLPTNS